MPSTREGKLLAQAVRRHAVGAVATLGQKIQKATVVAASPLSVEILSADVVIDSDHLLLGAWPRYYDRRFGIGVGDTVLVSLLSDGDWYVLDVISDEDFDLGDQPADGTFAHYNSGFGQVVAQLPYQDTDGTVIGVILMFDPASLRDFAGHTTASGTNAPVVPNP